MNWTGGKLQRHWRSSKPSLVKKQKQHFAQKRTQQKHVEDNAFRPDFLKPGDSSRSNTIQTTLEDFGSRAAIFKSKHVNPRSQNNARQKTLEEFKDVAPIANRLGSMRPMPDVSKKRTFNELVITAEDIPQAQSLEPWRMDQTRFLTDPDTDTATNNEPSSQRLNHGNKTSVQKQASDWKSKHPRIMTEQELDHDRLSLLRKHDWLGLGPAKPLYMDFPSDRGEENIGKRKPIRTYSKRKAWDGHRERVPSIRGDYLMSGALRPKPTVNMDIKVLIGEEALATQTWTHGQSESSEDPLTHNSALFGTSFSHELQDIQEMENDALHDVSQRHTSLVVGPPQCQSDTGYGAARENCNLENVPLCESSQADILEVFDFLTPQSPSDVNALRHDLLCDNSPAAVLHVKSSETRDTQRQNMSSNLFLSESYDATLEREENPLPAAFPAQQSPQVANIASSVDQSSRRNSYIFDALQESPCLQLFKELQDKPLSPPYNPCTPTKTHSFSNGINDLTDEILSPLCEHSIQAIYAPNLLDRSKAPNSSSKPKPCTPNRIAECKGSDNQEDDEAMWRSFILGSSDDLDCSMSNNSGTPKTPLRSLNTATSMVAVLNSSPKLPTVGSAKTIQLTKSGHMLDSQDSLSDEQDDLTIVSTQARHGSTAIKKADWGTRKRPERDRSLEVYSSSDPLVSATLDTYLRKHRDGKMLRGKESNTKLRDRLLAGAICLVCGVHYQDNQR